MIKLAHPLEAPTIKQTLLDNSTRPSLFTRWKHLHLHTRYLIIVHDQACSPPGSTYNLRRLECSREYVVMAVVCWVGQGVVVYYDYLVAAVGCAEGVNFIGYAGGGWCPLMLILEGWFLS